MTVQQEQNLQNLKKLRAQIAAANAALKEKQAFAKQMSKADEANNVDITAAVAES